MDILSLTNVGDFVFTSEFVFTSVFVFSTHAFIRRTGREG